MKCVWGDIKVTQQVENLSSSQRTLSVADTATVRRSEEEVLIQMAESGIDKAAAEVPGAQPLAVTLAQRDPMKRNFSQSLFDGLIDSQSVDEIKTDGHETSDKLPHLLGHVAEKKETPTNCDYVVTQSDESDSHSQPVRGVPLKHISSFVALTEVLTQEEKQEARKGRKAQSHYSAMILSVPVVIVTSEIAPWSKTGGLGLVAASYSYEFARNGHRTMAIAPKYQHYEHLSYVGETKVMVNGREELVKYWHRYMDHGEGKGCDMVFVDHPCIERAGGLYNGDDGREYGDNLLRFTLLSLAAMEAPLILRINGQEPYGDKVMFLANDWQAGLVPLYMNYKYRCNNCYSNSRVIYVIHNLGYQGQYHGYDASRFFGVDHKACSDIAYGNCVNLCKGALICADRVITVSPNYAEEIKTPQGGFNLQDFVCAKAHALRLAGILNGVDDCWNPETDKDIKYNYSVNDFEEGKRKNKLELQKFLGLDQDPNVVLIGFVGRLTWQKGIDVLGSIVSWLMQDTGNGVTGRAQLIMMGNGDKQNAETLRWAEGAYKGRVCGYVGFDPKVEHQMMAGCDLFLMPSRYEPCGLPQMYSQQYGTLPIVTATGGLVDSVKDISVGIDKATGFLISHLLTDKMKETVYKAAELYLKRPLDFKRMQRTAMMTDFYWPQAMDEYERHIDYTLNDTPTTR